MAGKLTDLEVQEGYSVGMDDLIETVDVSDTSMAATGTNKRLPFAELLAFLGANGVGSTTLPAAGSANRVLKSWGPDVDMWDWYNPPAPNGGLTDQALIKYGDADGEAYWSSIPQPYRWNTNISPGVVPGQSEVSSSTGTFSFVNPATWLRFSIYDKNGSDLTAFLLTLPPGSRILGTIVGNPTERTVYTTTGACGLSGDYVQVPVSVGLATGSGATWYESVWAFTPVPPPSYGHVAGLAAIQYWALDVADLLQVLDVSDISGSPAGTNKKLTLAALRTYVESWGITLTVSSLTATTNWDTLQAFGQHDTVTVTTPATYNAPPPAQFYAGTLVVDHAINVSNAVQTWTAADTGLGSPIIYTRNRAGGNWTPWVSVSPRRPIKSNATTTFAPVVTDESSFYQLSNASPITVTLPSQATAPFVVGAEIDFVQSGVGQVTFAAGGGATVNGTPGLKMRAQWSAATAKKLAANTWLVIGDLSA